MKASKVTITAGTLRAQEEAMRRIQATTPVSTECCAGCGRKYNRKRWTHCPKCFHPNDQKR